MVNNLYEDVVASSWAKPRAQGHSMPCVVAQYPYLLYAPTAQNGYLFQLPIFSMGIVDTIKDLMNPQPRRRPKGGAYKCQSCRNFFKAEQKICPLCGSTSTRADRCSDCKVLLADQRTQQCPRCDSPDTLLVE